jgi:hypothetical protein
VNRINIRDAEASLLRRLAKLPPFRKRPRIGAAKVEFGEFALPDSFFKPLPHEILKAFSGK